MSNFKNILLTVQILSDLPMVRFLGREYLFQEYFGHSDVTIYAGCRLTDNQNHTVTVWFDNERLRKSGKVGESLKYFS